MYRIIFEQSVRQLTSDNILETHKQLIIQKGA